MIEVKIAAITVRRCAKCLEFLAGKKPKTEMAFRLKGCEMNDKSDRLKLQFDE
jgi:hypothetical protein